MTEKIYNAVVAILAAEQHKRMITAGDCGPDLEHELYMKIDSLADTVAQVLAYQGGLS